MATGVRFLSTLVSLLAYPSLFAQTTLLDDVRQTIESSQRQAHELRQAERPLDEIRAASGALNKELAAFVRAHPLSNNPPFEDCLAMAICCEVLQRKELCLQYCHHATNIDPSDTRITPILVRTLLNLDQLDRAHERLNFALNNQATDPSVYGLRYLVYLKAKANNRPELAAQNVSELVQRHCDEVAAGATRGLVSVCSLLDAFFNAMTRVDRQEEAKKILAQIRAVTERAATENPFPISLLNYFDCEVTRLVSPDDFELAVTTWIDNIYNGRAPNAKEVFAIIDYIMSQNSYFNSCSEIHRKLKFIQQRLHDSGTQIPQSVLIAADKVERMLSVRAVQGKLVGTEMPLDVHWLSEPPQDANGNTLLAFYSPYEDFPTAHWRLSVELRREFNELSMVAVLPFTGFHWDSDLEIASRRGQLDYTSVANSMQQYIDHKRIKGAVAMIPPDSNLSQLLQIEIFPTFILLAPDKTIRMISYGKSKQFMKRLNAILR